MPEEPLFVDTNVFLRFFTGDDERMAEDCRLFFERVESAELEITTSHLAIAEIAWTLRSLYRFPREVVAAALTDLLDIRALRIEQKDMLRDAVALYGTRNVDFIDAYHAADLRRRGISRVCSYDRDFDRLGMVRIEPAAAT